jgi:hypothetical protein
MRKLAVCARKHPVWLYAGAAITVILLLMKQA